MALVKVFISLLVLAVLALMAAGTQGAPPLNYASMGRRMGPGCSPSQPQNCVRPASGHQRGCNPNEQCRGGKGARKANEKKN
ncbi:hypothetical protein QQP08_002467 [Theobroma cacao]|nr:hypothetical protein QQP08_002467 [Theobroma cacao]